MPTNLAAWTTSKGSPIEVKEAPIPKPEPTEIIIRTAAVAFNPVDAYKYKLGMLITSFPFVGGCDVAGTVHAVGSAVTRFKPGDRVVALQDLEGERSNRGCFQQYCAAFEALAGHLPEKVSFKNGCVLPMGVCVAATSLFEGCNMGLELPKLEPKSNGKLLTVWGGASSMGSCAIMMAKAAGYEVATTCSERNFEYCKGLGADHVFDYSKDTVVDDMVKSLKGKDSVGVFDAVMYRDTMVKSAHLVDQLGGRKHVATIMVGVEGQRMPEGLPEGVTTNYCWGSMIKNDDIGKYIWGEWFTPALEKGLLQCKPAPEVVGQGLESIQEGIEKMFKGVSATKLVVEME
ncbi:hypothetical protein BAUCODRAFT_30290 [Baudoinia panamericana UAMH 10762]|uniref:Enoyl reductase (ER) domain-containing protein n=1 Tax=Baudoinia panamericana (strain UAMH 10762) TaxID=717646 RepID=M2NKB5_BAUPA|nr:uncharacterized protein BAUCODRAFT_30290 [Baudoinia panamericana UAMH 10762]EMC99879.1 hypothetical protein BAUCODRAFT_30290 [Baudoinia panamericana UAMH 10762]